MKMVRLGSKGKMKLDNLQHVPSELVDVFVCMLLLFCLTQMIDTLFIYMYQ